MVLPRYTALRASSIARFARPARFIRSAELQPWQRMAQRRAYASAHGAEAVKKSDMPWAVAAVAGTGVGLYIVMNQDLSHGEGHDGHDGHDEHHDTPAKHEAVEESAPEEAKEEATEEKEDVKPEAATQEQSDEKPSETDKPDPHKEPKNVNEQSGKQDATYSNQDTKHPVNVSESDDKSKKGEGVADTAKVKGTVSTDRPPAENKEERGKNEVKKDE